MPLANNRGYVVRVHRPGLGDEDGIIKALANLDTRAIEDMADERTLAGVSKQERRGEDHPDIDAELFRQQVRSRAGRKDCTVGFDQALRGPDRADVPIHRFDGRYRLVEAHIGTPGTGRVEKRSGQADRIDGNVVG